MNRNHLVPRPTAPPTRGEEEKRAACAGNPEPFDILTDQTRGNAIALAEARAMCDVCPLRDVCLPEAAARGEQWARAVLGQSTKTGRPKGSPISPARAASIQRKHDDRLRRMQRYANDGLDLDAVMKRLQISRPALRQWCERHGHLALYGELISRRADRRKQRRAA